MKKTYKTDASKLNVEILHDFYPLNDDKDVYVEVEHLRNGDLMNFMDFKAKDIDYPKMFLRKVKAVHGIQIEDAEGHAREARKEDIVNIPDKDFLAIVMGTCAHLLEGMNLTEDESKN